jgi:cytochrome c oxidase subunit II
MRKQLQMVQRMMLFLFFLFLSACSAVPISPGKTPSMLDTHGPDAAHISSLWWLMFGLGTVIYVVVIALVIAAMLRQRRQIAPEGGKETGRNWIIWGGIVMPIGVLVLLFGYTMHILAAVENPQSDPAVHIRIIGRRWWWEVRYPDQNVITANEIHIPVGVPVQLQLESADVIHSLWIPQLHGKLDLIPTRINTLTIQADTADIYRGQCAEYCGLQHAHMGFIVVAESQDQYDAWIAAQQKPAPPPDDAAEIRGQEVFLGAGCAYCHTIQGLDDTSVDDSVADLGPNLTHLFSRQTIAAASLSNNRGNLAGWIIDAQHVKPGALMPPIYIPSEDLQALIAYLESLQ